MSEYRQTMTADEMAVVSELCGVGTARTGCNGIELKVIRQKSCDMLNELGNKDDEDREIINQKLKLCENVIDGMASGLKPRDMVKKIELDKLAEAVNEALSNESELQDKTESEKIDFFYNRKKAKGAVANARLIFSEEDFRRIVNENEASGKDSENIDELMSSILDYAHPI